MRIIFNCTILFYMVQFLSSCSTSRSCTNCGIAVIKARYYDKEAKQYISIPQERDRNIWYLDSTIIEEIFMTFRNEDENRKITWRVIVDRYRFIDLRTKEIYDYRSFSDTAHLIQKCQASDSACSREGWNFWNSLNFMKDGRTISMADTIIAGIKFKRVAVVKDIVTEKGSIEVTTIGYMDCNNKNVLILYDRVFSQKMGCPMLRFEEKVVPPVYTNTRGEIEYLSKSLNTNELKVFAAWKKNAKGYRKDK